uniref:Uncharacterized protein n=1 Tax=Hyaloperonospora arabidopsidis (strain Emoy2) TaxID=559515 RepID=M4BYN8_HYAAE
MAFLQAVQYVDKCRIVAATVPNGAIGRRYELLYNFEHQKGWRRFSYLDQMSWRSTGASVCFCKLAPSDFALDCTGEVMGLTQTDRAMLRVHYTSRRC